MITRFYFRVRDILPIDDEGSFAAVNANATWSDFFLNNQYTDSTETTTLFQRYIWPRFFEEYCAYIDIEHSPWQEPFKPQPTDPEFLEIKDRILGRFWSWLEESRVKYEKLIRLYSANENKLLDQLSTTSTTLFNDTPQEAGDFVNDAHTTNATRVESTAEVGTPMARLKEIRDNIENLYGAWSNEFRKFIIWR